MLQDTNVNVVVTPFSEPAKYPTQIIPKPLRICVLGLGYIGLPTAALFAESGCTVVGVDVNATLVKHLNASTAKIVEPGLAQKVARAKSGKRFLATMRPEPSDAFVISVPTPLNAEKTADLSFVHRAALAVAPVLAPGNLVILESTVPVGTTQQVSKWLSLARPDLNFPHQAGDDADIGIAYCPERVIPGQALQELQSNDRIIGGLSERATKDAVSLFRRFVKGACLGTDARTAEMCKLVENSARDVQIAFANELSILCDQAEVDVRQVIELANRHPRVNILQPGPGVGGHCIAIDPWFLAQSNPSEATLIRAARQRNLDKSEWAINKIENHPSLAVPTPLAQTRMRRRVACLGLSFKPDIDDLRESPALKIARALADRGIQILAVEPNIDKLPCHLDHPLIRLCDLESAVEDCDLICGLVAHTEFRKHQDLFETRTPVLDFAGLFHKPPDNLPSRNVAATG